MSWQSWPTGWVGRAAALGTKAVTEHGTPLPRPAPGPLRDPEPSPESHVHDGPMRVDVRRY
ncbi:hypothetical protein E4K73_13315 [Streptomyces sp. IB201691-2A2]|nr:hypothetical protein E4K73_13315 [Streptomyces sp. IB201691-2A2]